MIFDVKGPLDFFASRYEPDPTGRVASSEVYREWVAHCAEQGWGYTGSMKLVCGGLRNGGIQFRRFSSGWFVMGYRDKTRPADDGGAKIDRHPEKRIPAEGRRHLIQAVWHLGGRENTKAAEHVRQALAAIRERT